MAARKGKKEKRVCHENRRDFFSVAEQSSDPVVLMIGRTCDRINNNLVLAGCKLTHFENGKIVSMRPYF